MKNKPFIVFESTSKCGKTTLCCELVKLLRKKHLNVTKNKGAISKTKFSQMIPAKCLNDIGSA